MNSGTIGEETSIEKRIATRIVTLCEKESKQEAKALTPYRVSKNGDMNPRTLNNFLNGNHKDIRISTIHKICKGLNISLQDFFNDDLFNER